MADPRVLPPAAADRLAAIPPSGIRRIFDEAARLRRQGHRVIDLHIGMPDFDTPAHIKSAARQALDEGHTRYTPNAGIPELRRAIACHIQETRGLTYDPETEIIVTVGANEAFMLCVLATLNPGDEVLTPVPGWPHVPACVSLASGVPVPVGLPEADGFQLDPDQVRQRLSPATQMLVVNSPHNPTGAVFAEARLRAAAALAESANLIVVSDEIYRRLVYEGPPPPSMATLPGMRDRTLLIDGFSKTYAMTGWRLGWVAGPARLMGVLLKVHQYTVTSATSFAQYGALAALEGPQDDVRQMLSEFDRRRRLVIETMARLSGVTLVRPTGAFYAYPRVTGLGMDGDRFASWLLEQEHVAVVPGSAFGEGQTGFVRLSYGASTADVVEAMARIENACARLARTP